MAFEAHQLFDLVERHLMRTFLYSEKLAKELCLELAKGLECKAKSKHPETLGFPAKIDAAWHAAILNTKEYRTYCTDHLKCFVEHSTSTVGDSDPLKSYRIEATILAYKSLFEQDPPPLLWQEIKTGDVKIFVRSLTGKVYTIHVDLTMTVAELKHAIWDQNQNSPSSQRLLYDGKQLEDTKTLQEHDVKRESSIDLVLRLCGY